MPHGGDRKSITQNELLIPAYDAVASELGVGRATVQRSTRPAIERQSARWENARIAAYAKKHGKEYRLTAGCICYKVLEDPTTLGIATYPAGPVGDHVVSSLR